MTAETYAERKERERQRDAVRELAFQAAERTAHGDLNTVERVKRNGWPCVKFGRPVDSHRCECGMTMVPVPQHSKRWGWMPCWWCVFCDLPGVVEACEAVRAAVSAGVEVYK